ncbi:hypothetical protein N7520_008292 [Penicillium odoratum]|uniref:uncharacterized protein n=1 Tax=Penicillium odoratum TaxID=1167516 RepID=UPI002547DE37|nr:uncharacterized protein N7520_008292 [Penicillium odoratum]KAJ5761136.1 hypothetical protein N7520_008292 [Penicillium odoratum]
MLIDGQKWACEACIRGHRVSSCKHHGTLPPIYSHSYFHFLYNISRIYANRTDRPLIRIKRKGRPFATCSICHSTPCKSPTDHARQKRESELKHPKVTQHTHMPFLQYRTSHARLYPRHHNPNGFLPIAPRPSSGAKRECRISNEGAGEGGAERTASSGCLGYWSGSEEGSGNGSGNESGGLVAVSGPASTTQSLSPAPGPCPGPGPDAGSIPSDPVMGNAIFDPTYSLLPPATLAQTDPLGPLDSVNPFDFPLDPALADGMCLGEMDLDITEGLEEVFQVEDWSRYMWSPENGFEHLDMGYPPVTR